jgi:hypothetical protein
MVERDRLEELIRVERGPWDRVKNLISNILKDTELQREHTPLQFVLVKCQQALTRLRFYNGPSLPIYGSVDYQDEEQTEIQNESVFNQLVDNIKTVYTLEDKPGYSPHFYNPNGYSPKILAALESIVNKIILIGEYKVFITHYQLMTEQDWKRIIPRVIRSLNEYIYVRRNSRDENHEVVQKLSVLRSKLDTPLTQFIARPTDLSTGLNTYNSMVAEIRSFYTYQNMQSLTPEIRWSIHVIIICLMGYGRKYSFKLNQIEALDAWYWRYVNPRGYGTRDV